MVTPDSFFEYKKPRVDHLEEIYQLIDYYASVRQELLPRTKDNLYQRLRDFWIATLCPSLNLERLVGCISLHLWSKSICELKSLAVFEEYHSRGIGRELVQRALSEAKKLGQKKAFVLTRKSAFFKKLGFQELEKALLPYKVWNECIFCPKLRECDEVALAFDLTER